MKKKGFTLVELLGVIMLMGLIAMITIPKIVKQIKDTKGSIDKSTEILITTGSSNYIEENKNDFPKYDGAKYCIMLETLVNEGKLSSDIRDSKGNKLDLNKYVQVEVVNNKYEYKIADSCTDSGHSSVLVTKIAVQKEWNDNNNLLKLRPNSVEVELLKKKAGEPDSAYQVFRTQTLNDANNWSYIWQSLDGLVVSDNNGKYEWTVREKNLSSDYSAGVSWTGDYKTTKKAKLTNTLKSVPVKMSVKKVWNDENNKYNKRPSSVEVELLKKKVGEPDSAYRVFRTQTLNASNNWSYTWQNLAGLVRRDMYGTYDWTIREKGSVPNYTSSTSWTGDYVNGWKATITNTVSVQPYCPAGTLINENNNYVCRKNSNPIKENQCHQECHMEPKEECHDEQVYDCYRHGSSFTGSYCYQGCGSGSWCGPNNMCYRNNCGYTTETKCETVNREVCNNVCQDVITGYRCDGGWNLRGDNMCYRNADFR